MRKIIPFIVLLVSVANAFGQNLNRLQERANKFLELKSSGKKGEAAQYVEGPRRSEFLDLAPPPMSDAQVTGLEFTKDPKIVNVLVKATFLVPEAGSFATTVRQPWIWNGKDWFLHIEDGANPFAFPTTTAPAPPKPLAFELAATEIDLGKHVQGEILKKTVDFKGDRDDVVAIRQKKELQGLTLGSPIWKTKETGQLELTLDTSLLSESVAYSVELEVIGDGTRKTDSTFGLTVEIEPRLRFSQSPEVLDPSKSGRAEIHIENLSSTSFRVRTLALSNNTNNIYRFIDDDFPEVKPGQTLAVAVAWEAQSEPAGATLSFKISEPLLGGRITFDVPLHLTLPVTAGPGTRNYTKEELEQILQKTRK